MSSPTINNTSIETPVLKKRGRKSKKDIELMKNSSDNIVVSIEDNNITSDTLDSLLNNPNIQGTIIDENEDIENKIQDTIHFLSKNDDDLTEDSKPIAKKRGRKPKGGKIIQQTTSLNNTTETKPNVILHLKCSLKDLQTTVLDSNIDNFNFNNLNKLSFDVITNETTQNKYNSNQNFNLNDNLIAVPNIEDEYDYDDKLCKETDIKDIWKKLKVLEHNLHINNIYDKKSACFWCTYDFDNPPIYIPKHFIKSSYHVYGCFCSPECATAHLMEENIDSSAKFERYHMLNHIYCKIYDYNKNIKPAPNPYYMLDRYYGNLSIQEYRALLKNERLFLVVDKPLTRILPELHEDNDDFIINNKIIPSNNYQIKKKLQKKQTKTTILSERFGLSN